MPFEHLAEMLNALLGVLLADFSPVHQGKEPQGPEVALPEDVPDPSASRLKVRPPRPA